jgi:hypothetical protein
MRHNARSRLMAACLLACAVPRRRPGGHWGARASKSRAGGDRHEVSASGVRAPMLSPVKSRCSLAIKQRATLAVLRGSRRSAS